MEDLSNLDVTSIVDSLSDGVYVCDMDRRIVFWSNSAERITGWLAEDVMGRQCFDNVLCHIDKAGHHRQDINMRALEEALLKFSNAIRLGDDLTLIDVSFNGQ